VSRAKNPQTPPDPLVTEPRDIVSFDEPLWRVRRRVGAHPLAWNELREFGPLKVMRWDPHPQPPAVHPGVGVSYASPDLSTVLAEVFQKRRAIRRTSSHELVGWRPTRTLRLLDVTGRWLIKNGASASLAHGAKRATRAWARQVHLQLPDVDGLMAVSTWTGAPMVVLFIPATDSFPARPALALALDDAAADKYVVPAAARLGWSA
jgi:hypothetical protein